MKSTHGLQIFKINGTVNTKMT